jgi:CO/xanthine dehydrogenase Mo-binding subunit
MTEILEKTTFTRGTFLKGSGALVVGFSMGGSLLAPGQAHAAYEPPDDQLDSWLHVNPDNTVTITTSVVELGQGIATGFLQVAAEELDMAMEQMRYGTLSSRNPVRNIVVDTDFVVDSGGVGGSRSMSRTGPKVRAAAVAARHALLDLASAKLGVPAAKLSVSKGVVSGGGKSATYGELVGGRLLNVKLPHAALDPGEAPAKPIADYKLVLTRVPRVDIPDKISGTYTYVHNLRIPGMWHGRIVRPRGQGAYGHPSNVPESVDEKSIANIPDVQIVRKGNFLAVVSPLEYNAIQAAAQLKVKWKSVPILPGVGNLFSNMRKQEAAGKVKTIVTENTGSLERGLSGAAKKVGGTFMYHYQGHVPIGPGCAVADVKKGSAIVYSNTQNPENLVLDLAATLGMKADQVRVIFYEGSSSYGNGTAAFDVAESAAIMSQAIGRPVRSQWMRWDEHGWTHFGQGMMTDLEAGIDAKGNIVAYRATQYLQPNTSLYTTRELIGHPLPKDGTATTNDENLAPMYTIPNRRTTAKSLPLREGYFHVGPLRAPSGPQTVFASEQVIDMLAFEAGMDPLEFRLKNMQKDDWNQRWADVLSAAAKAAGWQPRVAASNLSDETVVTGRGIAIGSHHPSPAAVAADIQVNRKTGKILVKHLYAAQDSGLVVNPGLVENQMSGNLIMGASRALFEQVLFDKERVTITDWSNYPLLRFKDHPSVTTIVVQRTDQPSSGSGEPPQVPVAAAIANAVFDATGVRLHEAPMTPGRVRAALAAAKA